MNKRIAKRISDRCAADLTYRADDHELGLVSECAPHDHANSPLNQWLGQQLLHRLYGKNSTDEAVKAVNADYLTRCGVKVECPNDIDINF
jgi:hypothetical protein